MRFDPCSTNENAPLRTRSPQLLIPNLFEMRLTPLSIHPRPPEGVMLDFDFRTMFVRMLILLIVGGVLELLKVWALIRGAY